MILKLAVAARTAVVVSHFTQHNRQTKFPQSNSTGLSNNPVQIVHRLSVCVFVCATGMEAGSGGKKDAGAMAVNLDAISFAVFSRGLPCPAFTWPPPTSSLWK